MEQARLAGAHRRVVLLGNQCLRVDPLDYAVLEARLASAPP